MHNARMKSIIHFSNDAKPVIFNSIEEERVCSECAHQRLKPSKSEC